MTYLELLAPARNLDIGIAAIDCGADAVYIAAEAFGARQDAGNSIGDIATLCRYAHRFGVRIYVTVNTIVYENELNTVGKLIQDLENAGADALIVQDPALLMLARQRDVQIPLHASTQCSIRTPERARLLESLGFSRLVLERELTLEEIRSISASVETEIECFVHGAVCVCYNGQCYMSEAIEGRSANRGRCIQACRSLYDLTDSRGNVLVRNKALLSLKDMNLLGRLEDLAEAGACSFKIEGRLKSRSYVMNTVRAYSLALNRLCACHPGRWARSSFGHSLAEFEPDLSKTFNRGYSELLLDGRQRGLSSMEITKSIGETIGAVTEIRPNGSHSEISVRLNSSEIILNNGDGFCFMDGKGAVVGFRGDICEENRILAKRVNGLRIGTRLYRNINAAFEKELRRTKEGREIDVRLDTLLDQGGLRTEAVSEDGRTVTKTFPLPEEKARDSMRMEEMIRSQLGKKTGGYAFHPVSFINREPDGNLPFLSASFLNGIRRTLAEMLDAVPCRMIPLKPGRMMQVPAPSVITYKENVSNSMSASLYRERGAERIEKAFELEPRPDAELMRSKYCIRYELGLCPVHQRARESGPLQLRNNGRVFPLGFDCKNCEMIVYSSSSTKSTSPK